jgi:uncharacterized protein with von Willebrand factor type A (vWA) domain
VSNAEPVTTLVRFARALRDEGLAVGTGQAADFCRAAALLPAEDAYWAGRATLVSRQAEIATYDRVFRTFFARLRPAPPPSVRHEGILPALPAPDRPRGDEQGESAEPELALASRVELLKRKSFARCTPDELERLASLMASLRLAPPPRHTRRRRRARSGTPDLRRTIRRAFRTGGEPLHRQWRRRVRRPRRLVLLLDVSGSMSSYSRALLVFAHAALRSDRRWEAFCFGTRLTRLTRELALADPDVALLRASGAVVDWDGGTRIGETLKTFLDRHGNSGVTRGAVVVICSDGLEVGDPDVLATQMRRLARLAYAVVWVNPLKGDPAYEPLARGMHAALPSIDLFVSGHSLESLEALSERLAAL